jgi:predicted DNA-binding protein (UPF0251 family)
VNVSLKLRTRSARAFTVEPGHLADRPASPTEAPDDELAAAVHEELAQLSERERLPVVLCDLEGLSHADAATALGWPVGTVSGRLSRARAKLRERLARRGLTPSGALLTVAVAPPHLIPNAVSLTAGAVSPAIVSLAEGVLAMTTSSTWKWVAAAVVCVGALGAGGVLAFGPGGQQPRPVPDAPTVNKLLRAPAKDQPDDKDWFPKLVVKLNEPIPKVPSAFPEIAIPDDPTPNDPNGREKREEQFKILCPRLHGEVALKIEPNDDTLRKLLKARLHQGTLEFQRYRMLFMILGLGQENKGQVDVKEFIECLFDMHATVTELWSGQPRQLVPWLEELLIAAKDFERFVLTRVKIGQVAPQSLHTATRYRLKIEASLWKAKNGK